MVAAAFLGPALVILGVWIVYPVLATIERSFFDRSGDHFIWFDNYHALFTTPSIRKAIENNAIWVAVVPAPVTAIGLVFAVLTERIAWAVAFKTAVFMPMAVSLFAAGVIWHVMYQKDPSQGAVNALIGAVHDAIWPPGTLSDALALGPRRHGHVVDGHRPQVAAAARADGAARTDRRSRRRRCRGAPSRPSCRSRSRARSPARSGATSSPAAACRARSSRGELGLPGVTVDAEVDVRLDSVGSTTSAANGTFAFTDVKPGTYKASIGADTFRKPFGGVSWLGRSSSRPRS